MPTIKNERYKEFLNRGLISFMEQNEFEQGLNNIKPTYLKAQGKEWLKQARAIAILTYYTGRRPHEILALRSKSIYKKGNSCVIESETGKGGKYTVLYLPINQHIKEVMDLAAKSMPEMRIFYKFTPDPNKCQKTKKWTDKKTGENKTKKFQNPANRIYFLFKKFFGVPPYFLRHNRFSLLAQRGADYKQIKYFKGAKTLESVEPYIHLSEAEALKIKKYL